MLWLQFLHDKYGDPDEVIMKPIKEVSSHIWKNTYLKIKLLLEETCWLKHEGGIKLFWMRDMFGRFSIKAWKKLHQIHTNDCTWFSNCWHEMIPPNISIFS